MQSVATEGFSTTTRSPLRAVMIWLAAVCALHVLASNDVATQEVARPDPAGVSAQQSGDFAKLFDAVVERTKKSFWDKELIENTGWERRASEVRQSVVDAPNRAEAARLINVLLGELKTSHTGLMTPDDVEYYILLDVFSGNRAVRDLISERFWGGGVRYAGIGCYSVRIDGQDFVDAVLEASPADKAGLKVGDEIVSVDGAPYHPIRSFQGKIGQKVHVTRRRGAADAPQTLQVEVVSIAPLRAYRDATRASARVIERDGNRIGYVHVWASVGDKSTEALREAIEDLAGDKEHDDHGGRSGGASKSQKLDAVIIDMRGKIGGTGQTAARYLDLIDPRGPLIRSRNKDAKDRGSGSLRGRTAVLIDHHTRSTAELFVHAYKRERQGPLIGTRTAGAVSAAAAYVMPGGNLLYLAVTGLELDGEVVEGVGVLPDTEVRRPIPYANGADPVVDAAIDIMVRRGKGSTAEPVTPRSN